MIVADFNLATPILGSALAAAPGVSVAIDRVYTTDGVPLRMQFRARGDGAGEFDAALRDDPTVVDSALLADTESARRYRVELSDGGRRAATYDDWAELDGVLLSGTGTENGWEMRIRFPDHDALIEYRERCRERDISFSLRGLYSEGSTDGEVPYGLTEAQRDILVQAIETGYFDIPRSASLEELGDSLGITGQAASERLRRALKTFVTNALYNECRERPEQRFTPPLG
ncbi:helix-turn-helix domain-containing protein [Halegenticoccus tardaugens]|uniref:helix-turn-helix domain-containing protein n=1 Tax=Halegenticoccus tardaugens TaxID=2071624 RepID=UPI00100AC446|nr:helix-turn-helix domain-containing protein [Halegenticoccus tardaugens]